MSFAERLTVLCARPRHVAYFYESPDPSTFRYRVFNMVEALNAAPESNISASWFSLADISRLDDVVDRADALVICRARYSPLIDRLIHRARVRKAPVLFDVDDLIFDPDYASLIVDALGLDSSLERIWDWFFGLSGRIGATLRLCDGAITTNAYLAAKISAFNAQSAPRIVPNFLNRIQQATSQAIWEAKLKSGFKRDGKIHIGYFSGTHTHNRDFHIAYPALARIMDRDPRVILRIVGFLDSTEPLARYPERVEVLPLQDFLNLQRFIAQTEINMVPLQNNAFTNCKSELKYFEAAAVGTLTVATPTFAFLHSMRDGANGFLSGAHQWEEKLQLAIDAVDHPNRYQALTQSAHHQAVTNYSWDRYASEISAAVFREVSP